MSDVLKPYTINEVAERIGISRRSVIRLFESEPGVLFLNRPEKMHKGKYRTIRIPRHVYERVIGRMTVR